LGDKACVLSELGCWSPIFRMTFPLSFPLHELNPIQYLALLFERLIFVENRNVLKLLPSRCNNGCHVCSKTLWLPRRFASIWFLKPPFVHQSCPYASWIRISSWSGALHVFVSVENRNVLKLPPSCCDNRCHVCSKTLWLPKRPDLKNLILNCPSCSNVSPALAAIYC
jgi:hypothetical protein